MNKARPINLDLLSMTFPITAIASILHRVCAVIIWVGFGFLLAAAAIALESEEGFASVVNALNSNFLVQFVAWGLATATGYYVAATIKHLIQDTGFFEDLAGGKVISWTAIALGILISIIAGVFVWA